MRSSSRYSSLFAFLAAATLASYAQAADRLLYLEAQAVAGYSSCRDKAIFYSQDQKEVMQKPGVGFDAVQKFSNAQGDFGSLAVQGRLALNVAGSRNVEPQLYNAFFKLKTSPADLWVGHNRPALGLSSALDSHGLLLPPLPMDGFGFDRDWGLGANRDYTWGDLKASLTSGSGMSLHCNGNWLAAARASWGVLSRDNYSAGLSAAHGKTLDVMGYHLMQDAPMSFSMGGADITGLWNNWEGRFEAMGGQRLGEPAYALLWRAGVNLGEEGRLKLEAQPVLLRTGSDTHHKLAGAVSYLITSDLTWRGMYQYDRATDDHRVLAQIYYYLKL